MFCFEIRPPLRPRSAALASGTPTTISSSGHPQRAIAADGGGQRGHDRRRDRAAEKAGEGVDRKRAAHPRLVHMRRQDGVIGRMIDAVGKPQQHGARDQPGIAQMQAQHDQREAAKGQAHQQDLAGADMVGQIADRRLGQAGHDCKDGQGETEVDVTDAELLLQKRKQHRQHEQMEMTDPMRRRNRGQGAQRAIGFCMLRCGENVSHFEWIPRLEYGPARPAETIVERGCLSMKAVAWQPPYTAPELQDSTIFSG